MYINKLITVSALSLLLACAGSVSSDKTLVNKAMQVDSSAKLASVLASSDEKVQSRFKYRNPAETLAFFKVKPGMSVAEALPGGGWYSNILANFLGASGALHGINYNDDMWARFGFFDEEGIKGRIAATSKFPEQVASFTDNGIASMGFTFASAPDDLASTVDRVLFIRALHNLNRFEGEAGTMSESLATAHKLLKSDGLVGVVQHRLPETATDKGADGSRGYLKQSYMISAFEKAGFELVASSEINANPKDQPSESDIVWRLPPSYNGTSEDPVTKAKVDAIGESDRMTLLFKKKQ